MITTENYSLNKPESTDYYNVEHYNENMDIIDEVLQEHTEKLDESSKNYVSVNGGTINGDLLLKQGYRVHSTNAGQGSFGYIKIATIQITAAYCDAPIMLRISGRNKDTLTELNIKFANSSTLDPALVVFNYTVGSNAFYMHKADTGFWELYADKGFANDAMEVLSFNFPSYVASKMKWTWTDEFSTSRPAGSIQCTFNNVLNGKKFITFTGMMPPDTLLSQGYSDFNCVNYCILGGYITIQSKRLPIVIGDVEAVNGNHGKVYFSPSNGELEFKALSDDACDAEVTVYLCDMTV